MKVVTPSEMAAMDQKRIDAGISSIDLMELAGTECTRVICGMLEAESNVLVVCGTGNNGGDGQVIARQLAAEGHHVKVFFAGDIEKLTEESQENYRRLEAEGISHTVIRDDLGIDFLKASFITTDLIVDAIFGTGLKDHPLDQYYLEIIRSINTFEKTVVAIDIPSGLRGDNGLTLGAAVKADTTIIIQNYKVGSLLNDGPDYTGEPVIVDIGIDENSIENKKYFQQREDIAFPKKRKKNSHKYDYGAVLIIAGSKGMIGAGLLSIEGAIKSGAGLVTTYVSQEIYQSVSAKAPIEDMVKTYDCNITGDSILEDRKDVVLMGPGIGRKRNYSIILNDLLDNNIPVVIDADGIFHLKRLLDTLRESTTPVIMTPHMGEFANLIDVTKEELAEDPLGYGRDFAMTYGVTLVLKGYRTMIFDEFGDVWFNSTGNPGMATAGSGDVLAGIIAGIAGQTGGNLLEAARAGVFYHGLAGDYYAQQFGETTLIARDIVKSLKYVLK